MSYRSGCTQARAFCNGGSLSARLGRRKPTCALPPPLRAQDKFKLLRLSLLPSCKSLARYKPPSSLTPTDFALLKLFRSSSTPAHAPPQQECLASSSLRAPLRLLALALPPADAPLVLVSCFFTPLLAPSSLSGEHRKPATKL